MTELGCFLSAAQAKELVETIAAPPDVQSAFWQVGAAARVRVRVRLRVRLRVRVGLRVRANFQSAFWQVAC